MGLGSWNSDQPFLSGEEIYAAKTLEMPVGTLVSFTGARCRWNQCDCSAALVMHQEEFDSFSSRYDHEGCERPEYRVLCGCGSKDSVMPYELEVLEKS
jgi:hypothetical protein